ncbi:MAG: hypothetical protein ABIJ48_02965 [Actinomycetota bacterium]
MSRLPAAGAGSRGRRSGVPGARRRWVTVSRTRPAAGKRVPVIGSGGRVSTEMRIAG